MTALEKPSFISIEDYLAGEEISEVKHEYIDGAVHAMAGETNRHNVIGINALAIFHGMLRGKPCQPFNSDTKVRIRYPDHTRMDYPDAVVVCEGNPDNDHFQDRPVVIVEVLSDSTRRADLGEKRDAYLTISSLKVFMFVEPEFPSVIVHRRTAQGDFAIERFSGLESTITLPEIEAVLSMADLYDRVEFVA